MAGAVLAVAVAGADVNTTPALAAPTIPLPAAASVLAAGTASIDVGGISITGQLGNLTCDELINPYAVGEEIPYSLDVANNGSQTKTVPPVSGTGVPFLPVRGSGNCRWSSLAAGTNSTCATPSHTVSVANLAAGFLTAATSWKVGDEMKPLATSPVAPRPTSSQQCLS